MVCKIKPIAEFAKRNEIPVVIPFSKKVPEIDNNPFLFQFNANTRYSFQRMANLFENQFSNKNIIFIQFSQHTTDDFSGFLQHYLTTKKSTSRRLRPQNCLPLSLYCNKKIICWFFAQKIPMKQKQAL